MLALRSAMRTTRTTRYSQQIANNPATTTHAYTRTQRTHTRAPRAHTLPIHTYTHTPRCSVPHVPSVLRAIDEPDEPDDTSASRPSHAHPTRPTSPTTHVVAYSNKLEINILRCFSPAVHVRIARRLCLLQSAEHPGPVVLPSGV